MNPRRDASMRLGNRPPRRRLIIRSLKRRGCAHIRHVSAILGPPKEALWHSQGNAKEGARCLNREKYWYCLASPSLVLDGAYLPDTLRLTFLSRVLVTLPSRAGGHNES